ncbi:MAG: hypothetical protein K1000chlam2_00081 [Chlamydiae bacterium]|nr:hypothetical protein [Chlamydiota bacterium]
MKYPVFLSVALGSATLVGAAKDNCAPASPATCYPDDCCKTYCMGPENYGVNAPVNPITCNGDWEITVAGFYWRAYQPGMEYAIKNLVSNEETDERAHLIDAKFKNPHFDWDFGFKIGLGYNTTCDGWDFGVLWTQYKGSASSHEEAENDDNTTLLNIWSNFRSTDNGDPLFTTDMETHWKVNLNLVDISLGRKYWNSKRLALRPHIGIRIAFINQDYDIHSKGGSWSLVTPNVNGELNIDNDFNGAGIRAGFDTTWNFGCGWAIYGNFALSIINGHYNIDENETTRQAVEPHAKQAVMEVEDSFRDSSFMTDLALGIQYSSLFCDCQYGMTVSLGWEQHIFANQNQMWRIVNKEGSAGSDDDNSYHQRRGDLSTQGWTLSVKFDF